MSDCNGILHGRNSVRRELIVKSTIVVHLCRLTEVSVHLKSLFVQK